MVMPLISLHKKKRVDLCFSAIIMGASLRRQARGFSLTCLWSCLSSPFTTKEKLAHFSNQNRSLLRQQARGFSLTCLWSCLSSPFTKRKKSRFTLFSNQNGSLLRRQARGFSLTCRLSPLSSPFTTKEKFAHFSNQNGSLLRRQARGFLPHMPMVMPLISLHKKKKE